MDTIKPGDTVYVIATCADTLKRQSGICWFYESGVCPFHESGRLNHCGERETVPDIFRSIVESCRYQTRIAVRGLSFDCPAESAPLYYIGKRIFTDRADAERELELIDAKRRERLERARKRRYERNHAPEPENYSLFGGD